MTIYNFYNFSILNASADPPASTYSVTYDGNASDGGAVPTDSTSYNESDTVTVLNNTGSLTKTGYSFNGWNTASDGSGTDYAAAATFSMGTSDVTLYAQWTANSNTLTYDSNGGTGSMSAESHNSDSSVTLTSNTFSRTGYAFNNWNTATDGSGTSYADGASFTMPTSDETLYAQWTANSNTLTYDANGGSGSMSAESHDSDSSVTLTANTFTRTGYAFDGWDTSADGSGTSYADSASFTMPTSDETLYAQWSANSNTLTYDANTGSGSMSDESHDTDSVLTLTSNTFTKSGYDFSGWNTAADGSGTSYSDGASFHNAYIR